MYTKWLTRYSNGMQIAGSLLLIFLFSSSGSSVPVAFDPVGNFLALCAKDRNYTPVYILKSDIDNDGYDDILIALESTTLEDDNPDELFMDLYVGSASGYTKAGSQSNWGGPPDTRGTVMVNKMHYYVGWIPETNSFGLLTISSSKEGRPGERVAYLVALIVKGNTFYEIEVGPRVANESDLYERFFLSRPPAICEITCSTQIVIEFNAKQNSPPFALHWQPSRSNPSHP